MTDLKAKVYAQLDAIANAEKITRAVLAESSRDLLVYVPETQDIEIINRLIGVLTPVNRQVAIKFFEHFLPWQIERCSEGAFSRFGSKMKGDKQIKRRLDLITTWLSDVDANIWTWADEHIEINKREVNLAESFESSLVKALEGVDTAKTHGEAVDKQQIIDVVLKHITSDEMLEMIVHAASRIDAVEAMALEVMEEPA